jgi:dihydrofolate reductase
MSLSIIAAVSENKVIGREGDLPWRLPADLAHFRKLTMGHTIVMGRRTYESIGKQLPGRRMIVVTRQPDYHIEGAEVVSDLDEALIVAQLAGDDEVFIVGGEDVFKQTFPMAGHVYLTRVHADVEGDTYFPDFDEDEWEKVSCEDHDADGKNEHRYSFEVYRRREK